ncbi:MAG TPA: hypothetical protein VM600_07650 [Actinomycetota bacterium]|nr:hypothetical protein [Actinomycetota bacterium]
MRKTTLLLVGTLFAAMLTQFIPAAACTTGTKTAAGGHKDACGHVHCGSQGRITGVSTVGFYGNQTANGGEIEACSDSGPGNQQGRAMVVVDSRHGARVILDTDTDQPFPPGYIIVQASSEKPGVWCNKEGDPASASDGYKRSWSSPGTDGGIGPQVANCLPGN